MHETEHRGRVITIENDSTGPPNQNTQCETQKETKTMAKSKDDSNQNDEEEFYDSHSNIEELISDAEMHKSDPVTQIEVELLHDIQGGNHAATRKRICAKVSRKESFNGSHNGNDSVETRKTYKTEHLGQVITIENDSTGPSNQNTECESEEETKTMAQSKDDSDQNDEEEFYDSHSNIEELISDAEMHKSDPVAQIELELHHDDRGENHTATRKEVRAKGSRKESLNGSHNGNDSAGTRKNVQNRLPWPSNTN